LVRPLALAGSAVTVGVPALLTLAVLAGVGGSATPSHGDDAMPVGKLVVVPYGIEARRVEVASLNGRQRRLLVTTPGSVEGAVWSPHGDRVAVSFQVAGERSSWVLDVGGHLLARLRGGVFAGSWSPDGRRLLTDGSSRPECRKNLPVKRTLRLLVQDASTGLLVREFQLPTPPQSARDRKYDANVVTGIAWSPTGDRLAYFVSHYECGNERAGLSGSSLYVAAMKSPRPRHLYGPTDAGGRPAWAPNGRSLAATVGCLSGGINGYGCDRIVILGADGRNPRVVTRAAMQDLADPVIWPRQSTLTFGRLREQGPGAIGTLNLETGKKRWLIQGRTETESVVDDALKLSEDARSVVADAWNSWPNRQIVVARLDGSQSWRIPYEAIGDDRVADVYVP
jgi:hypothetical protein